MGSGAQPTVPRFGRHICRGELPVMLGFRFRDTGFVAAACAEFTDQESGSGGQGARGVQEGRSDQASCDKLAGFGKLDDLSSFDPEDRGAGVRRANDPPRPLLPHGPQWNGVVWRAPPISHGPRRAAGLASRLASRTPNIFERSRMWIASTVWASGSRS